MQNDTHTGEKNKEIPTDVDPSKPKNVKKNNFNHLTKINPNVCIRNKYNIDTWSAIFKCFGYLCFTIHNKYHNTMDKSAQSTQNLMNSNPLNFDRIAKLSFAYKG